MGVVTYSMMVTLDGFVETPDHSIDWVTMDEEIHQFANEQTAAAGREVYGRGMWAVMEPYWTIADRLPDSVPVEIEFARLWQAKPKDVMSRTLASVEAPNATLVRDDAVAHVRMLRDESDENVAVGGATIAASLLRAGVVDELRMYINPAAIGAGTPYLPPGIDLRGLRQVDTRQFASGVTYVAYRIPRQATA